MSHFDLKPVQSGPATRPPPKLKQVDSRLEFGYSPSPDGVDSNLLIFFHGLGDTFKPFAQLGKSLNLPQTAILSLQAPTQVPLLEEPAFQWWESFDPLGEIIQNPNPTKTLELLTKVISHLTSPSGPAWPLPSIHFFGFAQGASLAGELALHLSRKPSVSTSGSAGSIVAVSGGLLSHPTIPESSKPDTKVCLVYRQGEERLLGVPSWKKGYKVVKEVKLESKRGREGMPRGFEEWKEIMRFWSEVLVRRSALERSGEVYEMTGGIDAAKAAGVKPPGQPSSSAK
ncbi:alpha/beta hydrolase [Sporobolomyces salmoneus]|uniref:alpha/beta hydrolase n=1 Tax=Sporobolomyces salmoneus TaxID=183962 RepID=UPI003171CE2B